MSSLYMNVWLFAHWYRHSTMLLVNWADCWYSKVNHIIYVGGCEKYIDDYVHINHYGCITIKQKLSVLYLLCDSLKRQKKLAFLADCWFGVLSLPHLYKLHIYVCMWSWQCVYQFIYVLYGMFMLLPVVDVDKWLQTTVTKENPSSHDKTSFRESMYVNPVCMSLDVWDH